ncbi:MAG: hypothetical protein F2914_06195 [Actinobacteria bacterium]|nr:hypothetical protein [Actinomycetota bacterium]MSX75035.1 hypothetical protein [Actinomycetota bacterium]
MSSFSTPDSQRCPNRTGPEEYLMTVILIVSLVGVVAIGIFAFVRSAKDSTTKKTGSK